MAFDKPVRVLKANPDKNAGLKLGDTWVTLAGGDSDKFLTVNDDGIAASGSVSLQAMPNDIKIGGLATLNMLPMLLIPSTMTTPMSAMTISLPFEAIGELISTAASMLALIP